MFLIIDNGRTLLNTNLIDTIEFQGNTIKLFPNRGEQEITLLESEDSYKLEETWRNLMSDLNTVEPTFQD